MMMDRFDRFLKPPADKEAEEKHTLALLKDSGYAKQLGLERDAERVNSRRYSCRD